MSTYIYSIQNDTANGKVATDALHAEILAASLITQIAGISTIADDLKIVFNDTLSGPDETSLNMVVLLHEGVALKEEIVQKFEQRLPQGGLKVTYRGFQFDAVADSETTYDYAFTEDLYLKDGDLEVKDEDYRDYAYMALVDKAYIYAGVLYPADYQGIPWETAQPNGVVLHEYIKDYPVDARYNPSVTHIPNEAVTDLNVNGLSMRVKYKNHSQSTVRCKVRLRSYS